MTRGYWKRLGNQGRSQRKNLGFGFGCFNWIWACFYAFFGYFNMNKVLSKGEKKIQGPFKDLQNSRTFSRTIEFQVLFKDHKTLWFILGSVWTGNPAYIRSCGKPMQLVSKVPLVLPSVRIQLLQNKGTSYAPIAAEITLQRQCYAKSGTIQGRRESVENRKRFSLRMTSVCLVTDSVPTGIVATVAFTFVGFWGGTVPLNVSSPLPSLAIVIMPPDIRKQAVPHRCQIYLAPLASVQTWASMIRKM